MHSLIGRSLVLLATVAATTTVARAQAPSSLAAETGSTPARLFTPSTLADWRRLPSSRVTLQSVRAPLAEVLTEIGAQARMRVMYGEAVIASTHLVTLRLIGVTVEEAFAAALRGTDLAARPAGPDAVLVVRGRAVAPPPPGAVGTIAGVVTDVRGNPVPGAHVRVEGTGRAAQADEQGRYAITSVPAGARSVRATFAGYDETLEPVTVFPGQTASRGIALAAHALHLEGVVAVGYGTMRRRDVAGSIGTVDTDLIENRPIRGATEALTAQISGVRVTTTTGAPGSGAEVQIRGQSAVGAGASPLYVVDGVPITTNSVSEIGGFAIRSPLSEIPPDEIAEITVLKDASSAAIYGSQAANGVVIITTKRGQRNSVPAIDVQAYSGAQTADWARFPDLANATEFATYMNRRERQLLWVAGGRRGPLPTADDPRIDARWLDPTRYGEGTDWYRAIIQHAPTHSLSASVSGGSDRLRAYLSSGFLMQDGLVRNTRYRRVNARANIDANLTDRLTLAFGIAPTLSHRNLQAEGGQSRAGGFGSVAQAWPVDSVYGADGELKKLVWGATGGATLRNPVNVLNETDDSESTLTFQVTSELAYRLAQGVNFRQSLNARRQASDNALFEPSTLWSASGPAIPHGEFERRGSTSWVAESTLDFARELREGVSAAAVVGFSAQHTRSAGATYLADDYPDDHVRTVNGARTVTTENVTDAEWSMASLYGRVNLNFLERYVVTATARTDGSSRFGSENRWGTFPSIALAWHLSNEPFMQNVGWVSNVSLRGSLGYTGNNQIGNYPSFGNVQTEDAILGGQTVSGRLIGTLGNPELGWERSREMNLGLDASFLEGRVGATVEAYRRKTENLLLSLELPSYSGFEGIAANHGSVRNQGLELTLNTRNVSTASFGWTTNANLYLNRNETLELPGNDTLQAGRSEGGSTHLTVVGQPIGLFWGFRIIGVYSQADIDNACREGAPAAGCVAVFPGAVAGDMRMTDVNGDGVIRQHEDYEVLGSPWPDFSWGLTNNLNWGRVSLRAIIDGQVGGQRWDRLHYTYENIDGPFNVTKRYVENMYISPDSVGNGMTPAAGSSSAAGRRHFRTINSTTIHDADFVWIRNLHAGYALPERWTRMQSAQVYFSADNPYIFTSYFGNPLAERQGGQRNLEPGVDAFSYPIPRIWTLGVNIQM